MSAGTLAPREWLALYESERRTPLPPAELPSLFADRHRTGIDLDVLAVILLASWAKGAGPTGWPLHELRRSAWVRMFREVGYIHGGLRAPERRPSERLTLYRGATHDYRRGLSWTTTPTDALYCGGRYRGAAANVYGIDAEPAWMLARIPAGPFSPGGEYIVDVPKGAARLYQPHDGGPWRVLFVCVGNLCRSPLAELLLRRMATRRGLDVVAASVGVSAINGDPMDAGTLACAARHGLDGSAHVARRIGLGDARAYDCVVPLDPFAARITRTLPRPAGVVLLDRPVPNPWRRPDTEHEAVYRALRRVCRDVLDHHPEAPR